MGNISVIFIACAVFLMVSKAPISMMTLPPSSAHRRPDPLSRGGNNPNNQGGIMAFSQNIIEMGIRRPENFSRPGNFNTVGENLIVATTYKVFEVDLIVHSSVGLLFAIPLLVFILQSKQLRQKQSTHLFINLLIIHVLFNVSVMVSNFVGYSSIQLYINGGFILAMFFGLMALSLQRFLVIRFPFTFREISAKWIWVLIASSWLPTIVFFVVAVLVGLPTETLLIIDTVIIIFVTIVLSIFNIIVYTVAKNHDQFLKENANKSGKKDDKGSEHLKASYVCITVVASFILFWLPFCINNVIALCVGYEAIPPLARKVVEHIAFMNSAVDCILFVWLNKSARLELSKCFAKARRV